MTERDYYHLLAAAKLEQEAQENSWRAQNSKSLR
jgi:hypothetical protein